MTSLTQPFLSVDALHKAFVLHGQGGMTLEVMRDLSLTLSPGECLVLAGPSGIGKSTLLKNAPRQLPRHRRHAAPALRGR